MSSEVDTPSDSDADVDDLEAGVHARHSVAAPLDQVWQHLISPAGTEALLGEGARIGNKGEPWRASDGSYGVVRSIHAVEQVRVTWHPREDGPLSMLDVQLRPEATRRGWRSSTRAAASQATRAATSSTGTTPWGASREVCRAPDPRARRLGRRQRTPSIDGGDGVRPGAASGHG